MSDTHALAKLLLVLIERFPGCWGVIDAVDAESNCTSYLDVSHGDKTITVEWHRRRGWGVSLQPGHWGEDAPDFTCKNERAVLSRIKTLFGKVSAEEQPVEDVGEAPQEPDHGTAEPTP